ncbi:MULTISPECIES: glycosyltransferase [Actinomycetes]|uniref:D-inositol 3-phosphate glycosyltransferase n=2 Tax=Actinomycetes TaxID=1760 RepID=A0ABP6M5P8_9MICC
MKENARDAALAESPESHRLKPETSTSTTKAVGGRASIAYESNVGLEHPASSEGGSGKRMNSRKKVEKRKTDSQVISDLPFIMAIRRNIFDGTPLSILFSRKQSIGVAHHLIEAGHYIEVKPIIEQFGIESALKVSELRLLYRHARSSGYMLYALRLLQAIADRTRADADRIAMERVEAELGVFEDPWEGLPDLPRVDAYDAGGPILHMVGKSLPATQTGYTLRTQYTVEALRRQGIESVVAVQSGGNTAEATPLRSEQSVEGIRTVQLGGPARQDHGLKHWIMQNVKELYDVAIKERPSVLHAHSDFFNGVIATQVGQATGVPALYESRGFWEESWLSRVARAQGWDDTDLVFQMYGIPEAYAYRRRNERLVRERARHVVTLARVMRDHILDESSPERLDASRVSLAPNAVDVDEFPVVTPSLRIKEKLNLSPDTKIIGYISSIVEYEGIETLVKAFDRLARKYENGPEKIRLMIVGDGNYLGQIKRSVRQKGLKYVKFPGRVPHDEVLDYYSVIDLFVVPRRSTRVTELVTPLKPFEAFSTGRTVVMSDVAALSEIREDVGAACETFPAGDSVALSEVLDSLLSNAERRRAMAEEGARWVREARTWDSNVPHYRAAYRKLGASV